MLKQLLLFVFILLSSRLNAQIQVSKLIGKNSENFKIGYGGFIKFAYPAFPAADITLEGGANIFQSKPDPAYGWVMIPVKLGYRYTLNQSGSGFYIEPQVGYNVYGIDPDDNKFTGLVLGAGAGYLFEPMGGIQFNLGLLYETARHSNASANYLSLRLTHNFSLGSRDSGY